MATRATCPGGHVPMPITKAGVYGAPGHEPPLFWCFAKKGAKHRFAEVLPREMTARAVVLGVPPGCEAAGHPPTPSGNRLPRSRPLVGLHHRGVALGHQGTRRLDPAARCAHLGAGRQPRGPAPLALDGRHRPGAQQGQDEARAAARLLRQPGAHGPAAGPDDNRPAQRRRRALPCPGDPGGTGTHQRAEHGPAAHSGRCGPLLAPVGRSARLTPGTPPSSQKFRRLGSARSASAKIAGEPSRKSASSASTRARVSTARSWSDMPRRERT